MRYVSTLKIILFLSTIICASNFSYAQADQEGHTPKSLSTVQEPDFVAEADFSDELDNMIDQFNDTAFELKEPSRLVVFLRSVADPIVYYAMKAYNNVREHIHRIRVKILAALYQNNKKLRHTGN